MNTKTVTFYVDLPPGWQEKFKQDVFQDSLPASTYRSFGSPARQRICISVDLPVLAKPADVHVEGRVVP